MNNKNLGYLSIDRNNNLDFIRFFAATLVIFSHAFPINYLNNEREPFFILSNGQSTLGHLAVLIFFITSGFLITQSFFNTKNPLTFIKSRILRIFPALIVIVVLTTFILGVLVTNQPLGEYLSNTETYKYLMTIFLFPIQYTLPGVFTDNPYQGIVNGSLWTLRIEFLFYLAVLILGTFKLLNKKFILLIFTLSMIIPLLNIQVGEDYIDLFRYFSAGMLIYIYKDSINLNIVIAIISTIIIILSIFSGFFQVCFPIFGSYIIFYIAYNKKIKLQNFSKYGDFSYGLYIFAFPIQQLTMQYFILHANPFFNFLISFPITLLFSYLSWHFIEKPALKLKKVKIISRNTRVA